jgi:hypothetical protein
MFKSGGDERAPIVIHDVLFDCRKCRLRKSLSLQSASYEIRSVIEEPQGGNYSPPAITGMSNVHISRIRTLSDSIPHHRAP